MKKRISKILFLLTMLMLMLFPFRAQAAQKKLTVNKKKLTMYVGDIKTVKAVKKGISGTVKWKTSDKTVAKVSKGRITAIKAGTCKITAYIGKVKASVSVTVKKPSVQKNMEKFLKYYMEGNFTKALSYNSKLPEKAAEQCVIKMPAAVKKAYLETVTQWIKEHPYQSLQNTIDQNPYVAGYFLTDMTNNGVADLLLLLGPETTNNYRMIVYTYSSGKAKKIAEGITYPTWAAYPGHKGAVTIMGRMGGETIFISEVKNGEVVWTKDKSRTANPYTELRLLLDDHYLGWNDGPVIDLKDLQ